jgi:predicted sulfurtransferase
MDNTFHHSDSNNSSNNDDNDASSLFMATPTIQQNKNVESSIIPPVLKDWAKTPPAIHLSPSEWNDKLLALSTTLSVSHSSSSNNSTSEIVPSKMNDMMDGGDDDDASIKFNEGGLLHNNNNNNNNTNNVILLDARNMYETRIGHFAIPNISTILPNTRKFSNLPSVLNTTEAATALSGKDVYMYCTGGVRCERASSYLRALSESNAGAWANVVPPKAIYQLHGGIQAYLEVYGTVDEQPQHGNEVEVTPTTVTTTTSVDLMVEQMNNDCNEGDKAITTSAQGELTHHPMNSMNTSSCLYRGKNFVFDQRRTDLIIGNGIITTNTNEDDISAIIVDDTATTTIIKSSKVGRCIICSSLHDGYDNGFAPCDNREARCCRCRVLILVCNTCRANVRCWGEQSSEEEQYSVSVDGGRSNNDSSCGTNSHQKMDIYCGISGTVCVDDGNIVGNIEVARY